MSKHLIRTVGVVVVVICSTANLCRADQVDRILTANAGPIFKAVRSLDVENVAVLNFAVSHPGGKDNFRSGLANVDLARRLENCLLLANDVENPLFVLTGAGQAARDLPADTTWKSKDGRAALAGLPRLPLAWDVSQRLNPEGFVTGELTFAEDCSTVTLTLYGFSVDKPQKLVELIVLGDGDGDDRRPIPADRGVLAMAGIGYVATSVPEKGATELDAAARRTAAKSLTDDDGFALLSGDAPVKLEFRIGGQPVPLRPDPANPGVGRYLPQGVDPKRGDTISFGLTNTSATETYAVLLAVNGVNTNCLSDKSSHLNDRPPQDHRMWLLGPLESAEIDGFYTDAEGTVKKFQVLGDTESEANFSLMSDAYRGLITMHVFRKLPPPTPPKTGDDPAVVPNEPPAEFVDASTITLGVGGSTVDDVRTAGSPAVAKAKVASATGVKFAAGGGLGPDPRKSNELAMRGLIVDGETTNSGAVINKVKFNIDPAPIAYLSVRYYDKPQ